MKKDKLKVIFRRLGIASIISVYLLTLAGGIVRSTGSGMGCPDWPRCFGQWIPPTTEAQLPNDYKEVYKAKRHLKNQKLASYLQAFNLYELSKEVLNEDTNIVNLQFNARKTYIEYINRVLGVITGILIFLLFLYSFAFYNQNKGIVGISFVVLLLVAFQGWIGSLVVSTDLLEWMVTVHMLLAFLILALLILLVYKVTYREKAFPLISSKGINIVLTLCISASIIQVVFGTQVREAIDQVSKSFMYSQRHLWIENLGVDFYLHRSFSWFVLGINLLLIFLIRQYNEFSELFTKLANIMLGVVLIEIVSGVLMAYLAIPAILQPVHLFLAALIFGIQFLLFLLINFKQSQFKLTY